MPRSPVTPNARPRALALGAGLLLGLCPLPAQGQVLILESPNAQCCDGSFGGSLAVLPDLNGDGRPELVISAIGEDTEGPRGRVYIMDGVSVSPLHIMLNPLLASSATFGFWVKAVPDLDGDGLADLAITDPNATPPGGIGFAGRVHLFSSATGELLRTLAPPVDGFGCNFGIAVAGLTDVDGDGFGDVAVGSYCRRVHVFSGHTGQWLYEIQSPDIGTHFGRVIASVPDADGDGGSDIVVGVYSEPTAPPQSGFGRAYLFSGASGALRHRLDSPLPEPLQFGSPVGSVGDLDGDGRGDVLISAWEDQHPGLPERSGVAYAYSGATGALLHTLTSPIAEFGGRFGTGIIGIPDVDADGRPDIVVGARAEDPGDRPLSSGTVHVLSGATGQPLRVLLSPHPVGNLGYGAGAFAGVPAQHPSQSALVAVGASGELQSRGRVYVFAFCRADANADGVVNSRDISHFLTGWIQTATLPPGALGPPGVHHGDFNADGIVNGADITGFLSQWLQSVVAGGCP